MHDTRHKQSVLHMPGSRLRFVEVDEALKEPLRKLNQYGLETMFSCQGDEELPYGYISFAPGVVFMDETRRRVEELLGIAEEIPIEDIPFGTSTWPGERRWNPPRDGRRDGGQLHGWAIYFAFLGADRDWDRRFLCKMCGEPLSWSDTFHYHEMFVH